jgi:tetratricopeptide (TPR) repeat protein
MNGTRRITEPVVLAAGLVALVAAVYWQTASFPFVVYDDRIFITDNPALSGGLTPESVRWAFTTDMDAGWIPLTWLSRLLDVSLFGMDAGRHHLVNVLFHLANTLLAFAVLRSMTGKTRESAFAAAVFAVHPLHVESVAWVTERKDVLAGFFWLLSMGAYKRYAARPGAFRYLLLLAGAALGMMSKPTFVTFPFALLLLDFWPLGRFRPFPGEAGEGEPVPFGRLLLEKAPLFAMSLGTSIVTFLFQRSIGAVTPVDAIPFWARAGNALHAWTTYLAKSAWPSGLSVFYPNLGVQLSAGRVAASGLFLAAVTAAVLAGCRRRPWLATGWFWFLGTLVPVIGLVQVGGQGMADRCMYIPLTGLAILFAWGGAETYSRMRVPGPAAAAAAAACILAMATAAWHRTADWRATGPLFTRAIEATGENWVAQNCLGVVAMEAGRREEAYAHFREAIRIMPSVPEMHVSLIDCLVKDGRREEAQAAGREALRLMPASPEVRKAIGDMLAEFGRLDGAMASYREAIRLRPDFGDAHFGLAVSLNRAGRIDEAIAAYREAIRLMPGHAEAHNNLGVCLSAAGRADEAIARFRDAIRFRPGYADAAYNLGRELAWQGRADEASAWLREALKIEPRNAEARNSLGVLLAGQGRFVEAAAEFREAIRLKPDFEGARRNLDRALAGSGAAR